MSSNNLLALAKKIIRKAGEIGLEEAGNRICGPTAWTYVKKIISPIVTELEKRYPKLLFVPEEANKAAETLLKDSDLQNMLQSSFEKLESGQDVILAALSRQNETLVQIGEVINIGFRKAGEKHDAAYDMISRDLRALKLEIAGLRDIPRKYIPSVSDISISEIYSRANSLQWDAIKWVVARDLKTAAQRLEEARAILKNGIQREPNNTNLFVVFGYVEKTQAQIAQLNGDHEMYVSCLAEAAKYFGEVLTHDPMNVGALNGMANIYISSQDYDRAIQLGTLALHSSPRYGAAAWDLAIALEKKIDEVGPKSELIDKLKKVYRQLQELMPQQPQAFTASQLAHVQKRLKILEQT